MSLLPHQGRKLRRVIGYGGVALITAWSLLSLAAYAGIEALVTWMAGMGAAEGLISWFAHTAAPIDGPLVATIWIVGVALLGALTVLIRRLIATV